MGLSNRGHRAVSRHSPAFDRFSPPEVGDLRRADQPVPRLAGPGHPGCKRADGLRPAGARDGSGRGEARARPADLAPGRGLGSRHPAEGGPARALSAERRGPAAVLGPSRAGSAPVDAGLGRVRFCPPLVGRARRPRCVAAVCPVADSSGPRAAHHVGFSGDGVRLLGPSGRLASGGAPDPLAAGNLGSVPGRRAAGQVLRAFRGSRAAAAVSRAGRRRRSMGRPTGSTVRTAQPAGEGSVAGGGGVRLVVHPDSLAARSCEDNLPRPASPGERASGAIAGSGLGVQRHGRPRPASAGRGGLLYSLAGVAPVAGATSNQPRVATQRWHTESITGTSTRTPTTVARAAPDPGP